MLLSFSVCVLEHQRALSPFCLRPEAQKRINGQIPVATDVIETVIRTPDYWIYLDEMCAHKMSTLRLEDDDDMKFFAHAKSVFNRFHSINTKYHTLALFLYPMCRKLAVTRAASGRPFEFMVKVALEIALQWKWSKVKADTLVTDLKAYNLCHAPFASGQADGLPWWENLPANSDAHPLKAFAIVILSIVPHAAEVERLFRTLVVRANLRYHVHLKNVTDGKPTRRRHAHMHTTELPGIDTEVGKQLETNVSFVPPLSAVSSDNLEGLSLDDIDAEFARLEDIRNAEKDGHRVSTFVICYGHSADKIHIDFCRLLPEALNLLPAVAAWKLPSAEWQTSAYNTSAMGIAFAGT
ncbi:hypothetical protein BDR04DRAFT_1162324 [Suillus decipiens]|nr:hypothetical protein BDR04DRAFT_1162324 [Suillus decipiens]